MKTSRDAILCEHLLNTRRFLCEGNTDWHKFDLINFDSQRVSIRSFHLGVSLLLVLSTTVNIVMRNLYSGVKCSV